MLPTLSATMSSSATQKMTFDTLASIYNVKSLKTDKQTLEEKHDDAQAGNALVRSTAKLMITGARVASENQFKSIIDEFNEKVLFSKIVRATTDDDDNDAETHKFCPEIKKQINVALEEKIQYLTKLFVQEVEHLCDEATREQTVTKHGTTIGLSPYITFAWFKAKVTTYSNKLFEVFGDAIFAIYAPHLIQVYNIRVKEARQRYEENFVNTTRNFNKELASLLTKHKIPIAVLDAKVANAIDNTLKQNNVREHEWDVFTTTQEYQERIARARFAVKEVMSNVKSRFVFDPTTTTIFYCV